MLILRSILFNIGMAVSAILMAPLLPLALLLPYRVRYPYLRLWSRFNLWSARVICGLDYRVEGRENIPEGTAIILAKHQSAWETLALQQVFPPQTWVLKRSLLWIPFFGWGLAATRPIAIDRNAGKRALKQVVDQGKERLGAGIWLVIFPEGTRVAPGERGRYAKGGAILAEKSGYPVVPVAHNGGEYWPKNGFIKRPGTITLSIGPAIRTEGRRADEIIAETEAWIEEKMAEISATGRPS